MERMRRKYFCRVAALGMAMAVLTGCGGKSVNEMGGQTEELAKTTAEESGQKQTGGSTITWWTWSTEAKDIYEAYAAAVTERCDRKVSGDNGKTGIYGI